MLSPGQEFTFTIKRGVGTADCVSVNYDDFVNDVDVGDMLLVDGKSNAFVSFSFSIEFIFSLFLVQSIHPLNRKAPDALLNLI